VDETNPDDLVNVSRLFHDIMIKLNGEPSHDALSALTAVVARILWVGSPDHTQRLEELKLFSDAIAYMLTARNKREGNGSTP
jgi:hypothetical protein